MESDSDSNPSSMERAASDTTVPEAHIKPERYSETLEDLKKDPDSRDDCAVSHAPFLCRIVAQLLSKLGFEGIIKKFNVKLLFEDAVRLKDGLEYLVRAIFAASNIFGLGSAQYRKMRYKKDAKEKQKQTVSVSAGCNWHQLPGDILDSIMQRLSLADCIRSGIVCKSWRSTVVKQLRIKMSSRVPWLLLTRDRNNNKHLRFFNLCEGTFYNIKLPNILQKSWCCGSSKGWLVMAKYLPFSPQLFLFDPITGYHLLLPPLRTISCIQLTPFQIPDFIEKFELSLLRDVADEASSSDASCVVAATLINRSTLALCRPDHDKSWITFTGLVDYAFDDIVFCNGILYALIRSPNLDAAATYTIRVGDDVDVILKLLPYEYLFNTFPHVYPLDVLELTWVSKNINKLVYLVESNGELLIVAKMLNSMDSLIVEAVGGDPDDNHGGNGDPEDNHGGDGVPDNNHVADFHVGHFTYFQVEGFEVFKIDETNNMRLYSLGNRILFMSPYTALSIPARDSYGLKANCIFFIDDYFYSGEPVIYPSFSRESGVFYLEDGKIERCFPSMDGYAVWLSPNLFGDDE